MKTVSIILTKEDVKKSRARLTFWIVAFLLSLVLLFLIGPLELFMFPVVGLFFSLLSWYSNGKYLKQRGNIITKNTAYVNAVKNDLFVIRVITVFWTIVFGVLMLLYAIVNYRSLIAFLPFLVFFFLIFQNRKILLSRALKKS
ncbi:MAG: hypothetical protein V1678_03630 [Candidatus Aenigmatarchaeota archaeon]